DVGPPGVAGEVCGGHGPSLLCCHVLELQPGPVQLDSTRIPRTTAQCSRLGASARTTTEGIHHRAALWNVVPKLWWARSTRTSRTQGRETPEKRGLRSADERQGERRVVFLLRVAAQHSQPQKTPLPIVYSHSSPQQATLVVAPR